ncbi:hypothetical protein PG279_03535 [Riemerella anatipestifer]|nr:hypothetical protein [Riemerella anatipestifer]
MSVWVITVLIISFLVIKSFMKFKHSIEDENIKDKFSVLIDGLNNYCYQGKGEITKISKQSLNIYKKGSCQIVNLYYSKGTLTVIWKFKYFQQEMIYNKNFTNIKDVDEEWQLNALKIIIPEFLEQYAEHESKVDASGIVDKILAENGLSVENYKKAKAFFN